MKNRKGEVGTHPAFSFLVCDDSGLLSDRIENLLSASGKGNWRKLVFWGDEDPPAEFWSSLKQLGLLAENRAIVVRMANAWNTGIWKNISAALAAVPEFVWPMFCLEVEFEKGKFKIPAHIAKLQCMQFAEKMGWVWRQPPLAGEALQNYINTAARKLGLEFAGEARKLFCESVPRNAVAITNELKKLALAAKEGKIEAAMLCEQSGSAESDAFACIKKIENGDLAGAWLEASKSQASSLLFFLVALLARDLRILWNILMNVPVNLYPAEAAFKRQIAGKLGISGVAEGFSNLADAEWQVKSGRQSPEQALEVLLAAMTQLFGRKL